MKEDENIAEEYQKVNVKSGHPSECAEWITPVRDALDVLYGRWKLPIIISLTFGNKRFRQILSEIPGLTDKSLSKELKELEADQLLTRTVHNTFPPRVEYAITAHGRSLENVINELRDWGRDHRRRIVGR